MASAVDSRLAYARPSAVATASRLPTATRDSNNSYTTSWDTTSGCTEAVEVWRSDVLALLSAVGVIPFGGFRRDQYLSVNQVAWQIEKYRPPMLLPVEQMNWTFSDGEAA